MNSIYFENRFNRFLHYLRFIHYVQTVRHNPKFNGSDKLVADWTTHHRVKATLLGLWFWTTHLRVDVDIQIAKRVYIKGI